MKDNYFSKTKGQSAIEYLMTYGWMLLVVAIVGGAIFATVQGQCTQNTSGFTGADLQIDNFGVDGNDQLQMEIRNAGSDSLTLDPDQDDTLLIDTEEVSLDGADEIEIGVGGTETVTTEEGEDAFTSSDGCENLDVEINYDMGDLDNQVVDGTLTDTIEMDI